jgi:hypothetical protein
MAIVVAPTWMVTRLTEDLIATTMERRTKIRRTMTSTNICCGGGLGKPTGARDVRGGQHALFDALFIVNGTVEVKGWWRRRR